jgi:hypothetical protein
VDLGVEADRVISVALASEWMDAEPLDLARHLDWEQDGVAEDERAPRVLVVRSRLGDVPVKVAGRVGMMEAPSEDVMALPPEVLSGNAAMVLSAVVIQDARRPVVVLAPEGLFELFIGRSA